MKIAVSSTGQDLNALVDARFGRCQYFVIVDPETMEFEAAPNPSPSRNPFTHDKELGTSVSDEPGQGFQRRARPNQ
ncbi:hypothetical protein E3J48_05015 [Candidatus Aerophobetes bacterium]|uniref:Dinitrogenase iron-molybdenum cofactor biosynthesis domain-containing protein n=1 Tax=Aerophobetes bacterium TaxID=2030807 RepID=A0A523W4M5_UNCAE|nr:MAG: hypothetical protein E3J48_05015 [Candidatus Aerophobetes bacterium]